MVPNLRLAAEGDLTFTLDKMWEYLEIYCWRYIVDKKGGRTKAVVAQQEENPFLARSLEIDEELRTGKSRMLSAEETRRYFDKVKRESR